MQNSLVYAFWVLALGHLMYAARAQDAASGEAVFLKCRTCHQIGEGTVSSLRVANKAQERLFASIRRNGGTQEVVRDMQTRAELYDLIGLRDYDPAGRSKSPGYGHLKLPHSIIAVSAAEQR